jgi:hypothetical protein
MIFVDNMPKVLHVVVLLPLMIPYYHMIKHMQTDKMTMVTRFYAVEVEQNKARKELNIPNSLLVKSTVWRESTTDDVKQMAVVSHES